MAYTKQTWANDAAGGTPVSAARLAYMESGIAAAHALIPGTGGSSSTDVINVKDYGAVGNGSTDDTSAVIAARNASFASTTTGENNKPLYFPAGDYRITAADALINSPTTGNTSENGVYILGDGKRKTNITFDSVGTASTDPFKNNLITAANRLVRFRVKGIRFTSNNANQSWGYFYNSASVTGGQLHPEYGAGHNNQDFALEDVEWAGSWKRAIGLDGDWNTNLNSEWVFTRCHLNNGCSFTDAFLHSGSITTSATSGTDPAGHPMNAGEGYQQQDQYLNFDFYSCKMELKTGDVIKMDRGGAVRVFGGSWIYIDPAATGAFFSMAPESHGDSVMQLAVYGVRFELRSGTCKVLDTGWYSRRAHITFDTCSTSSQSFKAFAAESEQWSIRGRNNNMPSVRLVNCDLMGYAKIYQGSVAAGTAVGGVFVMDQCNFANWASGGVSTTTGFLRHTGTVPSYRFRDCGDITDVANIYNP